MYCKNALLLPYFVLSCTLVIPNAVYAADYVWVEAESGTDKVEHSNDWYDPVDRKTSLSGDGWWHSFDEPSMESGYVVCPFGIPTTGKYRLWIRLNLSSTGYRYAIDDAKLVELPVKQWRDEDREHQETIEHERRVFDDAGVSDHFAIIPTGVIPTEKLAGDARRLFDLVTRRFLGAFHPPAVWERVERTTLVAGNHFRTRSRSLQEPGCRAVLAGGGADEEEVAVLPPLAPGRAEVSGVGVQTSSVELASDET